MELNDFISNFAEQFDDTDISAIKADTKFRELDEWSSMTGLAVIAMIDEEYGKIINGDDMRKANTIEELFNIVKAK